MQGFFWIIRFGVFFFVFILRTVWAQSGLPVDPATLLFQSFNSKCNSEGDFTALALSDSSALEGILQSIVLDDSCKGLRPVLDQVTSASQQLSRVSSGFWSEDATDLARYQQKLTLMASATSDPTTQSALASELATVRINLARHNLDQARADRLAREQSLANLSQYITLLKDVYPSQSLCFLNHPDLPFQMAAQLLSLSGGFFSPVAGAALSLSGNLISDLIDLLHNQRIIDSIRNYRDVRMAVALQCAAEALENDLCAILDRKKLLAIHDKYWNAKAIPNEWRGYEILNRDYPVVQTFLLRVETGAPPQSELQGNQDALFRQKEGNYRATLAQMSGLVGEARRRLNLLYLQKAPTSAVQQVLINLLTSLEGSIGGTTFSPSGNINIYNEILPSTESLARLELWLRTGTPDPDASLLDFKVTPTYGNYLSKVQNRLPLDLVTLETNLGAINTKARNQLALDKALVLDPDQQGTIASWIFRSRLVKDTGTAMQTIINYLRDLEEDWRAHPEYFSSLEGQRDALDFVAGTRTHFQNTIDLLKSKDPRPITSNSSTQPSSTPLENAYQYKIRKIYEEMFLSEQDQVITSRMEEIVENDLQIRLKNHLLSADNSLDNIIALSSGDATSALFPGSVDHSAEGKFDLETAETIAEANLDNFFNYFKDSLLTSFKLLWSEAAKWDRRWDGSQRRNLAKLCMLTLNSSLITTPNFGVIKQWCDPQVLIEQAGAEKLILKFKDQIQKSKSDVHARLCAYRDFRTDVDIKKTLYNEAQFGK